MARTYFCVVLKINIYIFIKKYIILKRKRREKNGKKVAYIRTSTQRQDLGLEVQLQALEMYQPDKIYMEQISGRKTKRPELDKVLETLENGDTLLIYKLDRLGRTTRQLVFLMDEFNERDINLISVKEGLDTKTMMGRFVFTIMAAMAQFEAEQISQRTKAALAVTDKKLGRPKIDSKIEARITELATQEYSIREIAKVCEVSVGTVYNYVKKTKK